MGKKVLRLDSSIFRENGASNQLTSAIVEQLKKTNQNLSIVQRDLDKDSLPHISNEVFSALSSSEKQPPKVQEVVDLSKKFLEELKDADIIVLGAPMYNFGIPSTLKAWIDLITIVNETFRYTNSGPEGLLKNKTVYIATTRGGVYKDQPSDMQVPYLKQLLGFIGIEKIHIYYAEALNMGKKDESIKKALEEIRNTIK